jgi:hypothetical protein
MTSLSTLCTAIALANSAKQSQSPSINSIPTPNESTQAKYVSATRIKRKLSNIKTNSRPPKKISTSPIEPVTPDFPFPSQASSSISSNDYSSYESSPILATSASGVTPPTQIQNKDCRSGRPARSQNTKSFAEWLASKRDQLTRKRNIITNEEYAILIKIINDRTFAARMSNLTWATTLISTTGLTILKLQTKDSMGMQDVLVKPKVPQTQEQLLVSISDVNNEVQLFHKFYKVAKYSEIEEILEENHLNSGHAGYKNLYARIKNKYLFITREMCQQYKARCVICNRTKAINKRKDAPITPIDGKKTFHHLVIDLIDYNLNPAGPEKQYRYIAHMVDHLSTFHFTEAIREKNGDEVLHFIRKTFAITGFPAIIHSDNGREFINNSVEAYLQIHNIEYRHGKPYKPTTQGKVERGNRTLKETIRKLVA